MRRTVVFEVIVMKESLRNVCDRYGINFSSAKNVIQIYKKEGRLEKKNQRTKKSERQRDGQDCSIDSEFEDDDCLNDNTDDILNTTSLAPESQRCKLNLIVQPNDDEDGNQGSKAYF